MKTQNHVHGHKKAIFAGSFDPTTNGHVWIIQQGSRLFDELEVAVGVNPDKRSTFTLAEKLTMLQAITKSLPNVTVSHFENQYLVDYAQHLDCRYLLRGLRSTDDFVYEQRMHTINTKLAPTLHAVYLMSPPEFTDVSSSTLKDMIRAKVSEEHLSKLIPASTLEVVRKYYSADF